MSDTPAFPAPGHFGWVDIAVPDADGLRDFYVEVAGWTYEPLDMGGYADYVMKAPDGEAVGGICHARGPNAHLPPMWLPCVTVTDLDGRLAACRARGGTVLTGPVSYGDQGRYAAIRDPAGAALALFEPRAA